MTHREAVLYGWDTGKPVRYYPMPKPWWAWLRFWKPWQEFRAVVPGEAGYEDAPYELAYIWDRTGVNPLEVR